MESPPDELKGELQTLGRLRYHRLRRIAAWLNYYRIDTGTIVDRLIERGCSRELADWIVRTASADANLAKKVEEDETPESTTQVVLKGLNGLTLLVIVGLVGQWIQLKDSLALLFVIGPFLVLMAFGGFFMTMRMILELKRRATKS